MPINHAPSIHAPSRKLSLSLNFGRLRRLHHQFPEDTFLSVKPKAKTVLPFLDSEGSIKLKLAMAALASALRAHAGASN